VYDAPLCICKEFYDAPFVFAVVFVMHRVFIWHGFYGAPCVFSIDFRCRFISLLSYEFRSWSPALALSVLHQTNFTVPLRGLFPLQHHFLN